MTTRVRAKIAGMRTYWLHILGDKSPQPDIPSTYLLVRANAPDRNLAGHRFTTHHGDSFAKNFRTVGIDGGVLQDAKEN